MGRARRTSMDEVELLRDHFNSAHGNRVLVNPAKSDGKLDLELFGDCFAYRVRGLCPGQVRQVITMLDTVHDDFERKVVTVAKKMTNDIEKLEDELAKSKQKVKELTAFEKRVSDIPSQRYVLDTLHSTDALDQRISMDWVCAIVRASFKWPQHIVINPVDGVMFNDVYSRFNTNTPIDHVTQLMTQQQIDSVKAVLINRYLPTLRIALTLLQPWPAL